MIKVGSSFFRKFQFFEVVKDPEIISNNQPLKNSINKNEEQQNDNFEIDINNISISDPKQMKIYDNKIFINGRATHKKSGQMVRENLIMKIENNIITDEYFIFNLVYYDFSIKIFDDNPYFIILGCSYCEIPQTKEVYTITKIKIYNGKYFLKNDKIKVTPGYEKGFEPFPQALKKEIKLLKKLDNGMLFADEGKESMKLFETIQSINEFAMDENFTYAAFSVDRGGIILMYGYPNLLDCNNSEIKMKYLPHITYHDKDVNVTNIQFSYLTGNSNEQLIILYVATGNSIYYYQWDYEPEKINFPNNLQPKAFIEEKLGTYNSRMKAKGNYLLVGNEKILSEYNNLTFEQNWFFEGKKTVVNYFNDYIYFAIFGEEENSIQIFDKKNKFFVYQKTDKNKILSVCNDNKYICIFYEETPDKKYIIKLKEKNNKEKFDTFFNKKFFDSALIYAKNLGFNEEQISEISLRHAQYEFSKGHYDRAIEEYIKTIKYYEPSIIIQKFLDKSKFNYLIKYLEAIVENYTMDNMDEEECKNYTTLLLHCYIMQKEINKLKDFVEKKGQIFSKELMKVAIDVCIETDNADIGLSIAKQNKMIYEYIYIMLVKLNEYEKVIEILEIPEKYEFNITNKEKVELYLQFADYYLLDKKDDEDINEEKEEENYSDKFFDSVLAFIEGNKKTLDKNDIVKLIELFMDTDKFFKKLFESLSTYDLNYSKEIIHRRIQLYLEDMISNPKDKNYKLGIISILKDKKYISIYDSQYLIMLFKTNHFLEGIETISEINRYNQDLLSIYMQKREYEKIINICKNFGSKEISFWGTSLNYFISKELRENKKPEELDTINKYLEEFLDELLKSKIMPAIDVLDMINEQNCDITYNILNHFMENALNNELNSIDDKKNNYNECEVKINNTCDSIKEINTKAHVFNVNRCSECGTDIDIPYYAFYCGHAIHKNCLNINVKDDNIECQKCREVKKGVSDEIQKNKKYERLDGLSKVESVLERKENKIDFIYSLYGKGLFNFNDDNQKKD